MSSASQIRDLAASTAEALRQSGAPVQSLISKRPHTEVHTSGLFGRKKHSVTTPVWDSQEFGWKLWSQHQAQTEEHYTGANGFYRTEMKFEELWLSVDGELHVVEVDKTYYHPGEERDIEENSTRAATDDDLAHPDYEWVERDHAPAGDPVLRVRSQWQPVAPGGMVSYRRIEESLRQLAARG